MYKKSPNLQKMAKSTIFIISKVFLVQSIIHRKHLAKFGFQNFFFFDLFLLTLVLNYRHFELVKVLQAGLVYQPGGGLITNVEVASRYISGQHIHK